MDGYRVRWLGCEADEDTYQTHRQLQIDLNRQELDGMVNDLENRETLGQVQLLSAADVGFSNWSNYLGGAAIAQNQSVTPSMRPFPTAGLRANASFATFDGISLEQLRILQQVETDTKDFIKRALEPENSKQHTPEDAAAHRPTFMKQLQNENTAMRGWEQFADSCSLDEESGLLMRKYTPTEGINRDIAVHAIVLPQTLITKALTYAHECAGHHGIKATQWVMRTRFSFRYFAEWIEHHVKSCAVCCRAQKEARPAPFGHIPIGGMGDSVGFDFAGPMLALGPEGCKNFCVIVDQATKGLRAYPTVGQTAHDALEALTAYIQETHVIPKRIFSDQGAFTSTAGVWRQLMARFHINSHQSTPMHPEGDAIAEANVKNAARIVRKAVQGHEDCWDKALKWAVMFYNWSYHSSIGMSPFYATHGREANTTLSELIATPANGDEHMDITTLLARIQRVEEEIKRGTEALAAANGKRNEGIKRTRSFSVNDLVYLDRVYPDSFVTAGIDTKFWMPYRPELYIILEKRSERIYHIRRADNPNEKVLTIHVQRLKPYEPRENALRFEDFAVPTTQDETPS